MILILKLIFILLRILFKSKEAIIMELLAKDQQLATYTNTIKKVKIKNSDRRFWVALSKIWPGCYCSAGDRYPLAPKRFQRLLEMDFP